MKYTHRRRITSVIILSAFLVALLLPQIALADTLRGRDFVRLGEINTLHGTLVQEGTEWTLRVSDKIYAIHLGPSEYRESNGYVLTDGAEATVKGFVYEQDVTVTTIETGGKVMTLRDETGRPAWAGTQFGKGSGKSWSVAR